MVAGPLFALAAFVVSPAIHTDASGQLGAFAAHPDRTLIAALLSLAAVALMIGATLGLMHMLRERMVAYGHVGGGLALLGLVAWATQCGMLMLGWQMVADGVQPGDVAAWQGMVDSTAVLLAVQLVIWLGAAGFVVLAAGLFRARAVEVWVAAFIAVGAVGIVLAAPFESVVVGIAGAALLLVGLGSVGAMVLRETDAEWEHTPETGGMRPAARMG
jgi:hypothetical protein